MDFAQEVFVGGSNGQIAEVVDNALSMEPRSAFAQAVLDGRAFAWTMVTYDPDAHDTIIAVQNTHPTKSLRIHRIHISSDTASQIQVFVASGVTMAGTAITGVNLNRGSGRLAQATAKADETGNGEQASSYPTLMFRAQLAANTQFTHETDGGIILPYNIMLGVDLTTAATGADGAIIGWYDA
jgi:hypothetical protein